MENITSQIKDLAEKRKVNHAEQAALLGQLGRQLAFKAETGLDAHEITRMVLHPMPPKGEHLRPIEYETTVTLRDGRAVRLSFNVRDALSSLGDRYRS